MRRLITLVLTLTVAALGMWADSQTELNRHLKDYNARLSARQYLPAAKSAAAAAAVCADAHNYDGAFRLLGNFDKALAGAGVTADSLPAVYYTTEKARYETYRRIKNNASAAKSLSRMATFAKKANNKEITNDMLFNEAQYYYSIDQNNKGDICIARLIKQFDNSKDYKAADTAYRNLINRAVSVGDAELVEHTYENYMAWSDSIEAANADTELGKVKKEYEESQDTIAEKDHTIATRTGWIVTFITLFVIALAALAIGAIFYWRILSKNRRMKKNVEAANAQSAAKSAILHNMSSQMEPTLERLDQNDPSVRNLRGYVKRVGELSDVGNSDPATEDSLEDVNLSTFCETIASKVRLLLKPRATLVLNGTKGFARINPVEVEKILTHLLENAAKFTPDGGKISLTYRKRGAKVHQFIVTDSGPGIPEEERATIFTAFSTPHDISEGDRLGLPICALRAEKINGSLELDPEIANGTSFILTIHNN
ncbi:MAG: ATP-binding protein [Staphylococcus sp.]|nr:ATP-binding protein [Staphylococcus sp.]